ncbi:DNA-processing protein DprA [Cognatishimia maritima]|uniref:DNA protecting protein DprA n=1 Tax=Cognatishimia maritima TaxID=870908 RepID=A0A1M5VCM0_9RHOB|nr:DNA-processing protein DprA [Cognatishimia maritima]SHH72965.1 DNA protecting protein DprA [Cognatishimia maritima]
MTDIPFSTDHPQLAPKSDEDKLLWLRLLRSRRVGPTTFFRLLSEHGSIAAAFAALPQIAAEAGVKDYQPCTASDAQTEMTNALRAGAKPLFYGAPNFPKPLYDLADPPPLLWAKGNLKLLSKPQIALVGARNASSLGMRMSRDLAVGLGSAGHVVVSGLARGVDTAAHQAALKTGTIAVFAGGVDVTYPAENNALAAQIADCGVILSEQPMGMPPRSRHFPARNRIISGLARAVVVVEAAVKSGSMLTARDALDQGREVFAVPGHPIDARASGCNLLIRDGATLVRCAKDILDALAPLSDSDAAQTQQSFNLQPTGPVSEAAMEPPPVKPIRKKAAAGQDTSNTQTLILERIADAPTDEDRLIRDLRIPAHQMTAALVDLELAGQISRSAGGMLSRR